MQSPGSEKNLDSSKNVFSEWKIIVSSVEKYCVDN